MWNSLQISTSSLNQITLSQDSLENTFNTNNTESRILLFFNMFATLEQLVILETRRPMEIALM